MRKVVFIRLGAIVLLVGGILISLLSVTTLPNSQQNGFVRNWIENGLMITNKFPIKEKLTKIVGVSGETVYLTGDNPLAILILNTSSLKKDTLLIKYDIPPEKIVPFYLYVDSPKLFLHMNNMQMALYGSFPNSPIFPTTLETEVFTKSVQIDDSLMVVRSFDESLTKQVFKKINIKTGKVLMTGDFINENDLTAGTGSDGSILYSKKDSSLYYVEYFRNRIYCVDMNFKLRYRSSTIDTINTNSIKLEEEITQDSTRKFVPSAARTLVNSDCMVDDRYLYVVSALRSDDQSVSGYNRITAIDRYTLNDGKYSGSLKIDKQNLKNYDSFFIKDNTLWGLSDGVLVAIKLPE